MNLLEVRSTNGTKQCGRVTEYLAWRVVPGSKSVRTTDPNRFSLCI